MTKQQPHIHNNTNDSISADDQKWMAMAINSARISAASGEVPVGALLVKNDTLITAAGNRPIGLHDPTAHAEIRVLREAASLLQNYRLPGTTLYVTLEPCLMCMGAILHARVGRLVFGATDPKTGAATSQYQIGTDGRLNHNLSITSGVMELECGDLLKKFFQARR